MVNNSSQSTLLLLHKPPCSPLPIQSLSPLRHLPAHTLLHTRLCSSPLSDLHVEGLFRVPGHSLRQAALREMLNSGADIDLEAGGFHPNDAATLLKSYLGELPEPLLTHRHYHVHLKIGGIDLNALSSDFHRLRRGKQTLILSSSFFRFPLAALTRFDDQGNKTNVPDKERQIEAFQLLLMLLPPANRSLLKLLLDLLYHTARNQQVNKMSAINLATMFAPHIIWPKNVRTPGPLSFSDSHVDVDPANFICSAGVGKRPAGKH